MMRRSLWCWIESLRVRDGKHKYSQTRQIFVTEEISGLKDLKESADCIAILVMLCYVMFSSGGFSIDFFNGQLKP